MHVRACALVPALVHARVRVRACVRVHAIVRAYVRAFLHVYLRVCVPVLRALRCTRARVRGCVLTPSDQPSVVSINSLRHHRAFKTNITDVQDGIVGWIATIWHIPQMNNASRKLRCRAANTQQEHEIHTRHQPTFDRLDITQTEREGG